MNSKVAYKEKAFLDHVHYFRGFSILLIVASHILVEGDESVFFYRVLSALFLNSTLFFVFVSGFLFQHLSHKYDARKYWRRKLETIVLPYLIVSLPAIALRLVTGPPFYTLANFPDFANWSIFQQIGYYYLTGAHLLPYWYIPMIVLYFTISPLLIYLDEKKDIYWLLPVFITVSLLLPRDNINDITNTVRMFAHFFSVYLFGMFVSRYKDAVTMAVNKYWTLFLAVGGGLLIVSCFPVPFFEQVVFLQKLIFCIIILYLFKQYAEQLPRQLLGQLAQYSFGIYFLHYYVVLALREASAQWLGYEKPINLLEWIVSFMLVTLITYGMVAFAKRILGRQSRKIIGS